jgi:Sec-independent protein translocase protein TatA
VTLVLVGDDVEELTKEIRKLIESNKQFLDRVNDEEYEDEDEDEEAEADTQSESGTEDEEDYEEL